MLAFALLLGWAAGVTVTYLSDTSVTCCPHHIATSLAYGTQKVLFTALSHQEPSPAHTSFPKLLPTAALVLSGDCSEPGA